ncbi:MAG: MBL fold metallo-hydrolase [Planctomycetota bacterium]
MTIALEFLGAARHVTGSKHLLCVNEKKILLDCGLVQGPRKVSEKANRNLPVRGPDVDAVVLSHAHIDHSGALPRLVKDGFRGPIWCTEATADMLDLMLKDSAHIQAMDARYLRKRGHDAEPLYSQKDVEQTLQQVRSVPYYAPFELMQELRVEFLEAGHILGAAIVVLDADSGRKQRRIVFTGDHGRKDLPILRDPDPLPECDALITESTYGNRIHEPRADMMDVLADIITEEQNDGGRVLIPAFSVGRTQSVVLFLGELMRHGRLQRLPIYVDSPMSRRATHIMKKHEDLYDDETKAILKAGHKPLFYDGVTYVDSVEQSMSLNEMKSGIIISASGMVESGRILHHLKVSASRKQDCVLTVGFQANGTLGRRLANREKRVRIFGEWHDVQCRLRSMHGFSAHADWRELIAQERPLAERCKQAFVVHGEDEPAEMMAKRLRNVGFSEVHVPSKGDRHELR